MITSKAYAQACDERFGGLDLDAEHKKTMRGIRMFREIAKENRAVGFVAGLVYYDEGAETFYFHRMAEVSAHPPRGFECAEHVLLTARNFCLSQIEEANRLATTAVFEEPDDIADNSDSD